MLNKNSKVYESLISMLEKRQKINHLNNEDEDELIRYNHFLKREEIKKSLRLNF